MIPERAAGRIWVRALDPAELDDAVERVSACARGAAESSGTRLELREESSSSPAMKVNLPLARGYGRQLSLLHLPETAQAPDDKIGSSDITHVSRVVPTIHPNFPIGEQLELHSKAFEEATRTPRARDGLLEGARCLALTVQELLHSPEFRREVREAG